MPFCSSCGESVEAGASTCSKCNAELVSCEKCGHIQIAASAEGNRMETKIEQIKADVEREMKEAKMNHEIAMLLKIKQREEMMGDLASEISTRQFVAADGVRERREMMERMMVFSGCKSEKGGFEIHCASCGAGAQRDCKFCGKCGGALQA